MSTASPRYSDTGRYVAFASRATILAAGQAGVNHVYVRDRLDGTTHLVSVDSDEVPGDSASQDPAISGSGNFVAFDSFASNLWADDDNNNKNDVFLRRTAPSRP